jgi:hypothetical protein
MSPKNVPPASTIRGRPGRDRAEVVRAPADLRRRVDVDLDALRDEQDDVAHPDPGVDRRLRRDDPGLAQVERDGAEPGAELVRGGDGPGPGALDVSHRARVLRLDDVPDRGGFRQVGRQRREVLARHGARRRLDAVGQLLEREPALRRRVAQALHRGVAFGVGGTDVHPRTLR